MSQQDQLPAPYTTSLSLAQTGQTANNGAAAPNAEGESLQETLTRCHRALRGRYLTAIGLGIVCALLFAFAGWKFAPYVFKSEGLVRIAYELPQVFQETNQNKPMATFDAFLQSQKLLITSRRMIDQAMREPAWQSTGKGTSNKIVQEFAENLMVVVDSKTEYIRVIYADRDPAVAAAGTNSVIAVYERLYNGQDRSTEKKVLEAAEERRQALTKDLEQLNGQMDAIAAEVGSGGVDPLFEAATQRVAKLQGTLLDVQVSLARFAADTWIGAPPSANSARALLINQIASRDPNMRKYLDDLIKAEWQLQKLSHLYGDNHRLVTSARAEMNMARSLVEQYADDYVAVDRSMPNPSAPPMSKDALVAEEKQVTRLLEQAKQEMIALGVKRRNLQNLTTLRDANRDELIRVTRRVESLVSEGALGGRLSVISAGEVPVAPSRNLRLPAAAVGMLAGGMLPGALLLLWGLCRGRYRYSDDALANVGHGVPLLGILPMLNDDPSEQDAVAAQCVHQIRVHLHSSDTLQRSRAYVVTSSTAGEGKTSLSLALGISFAASGVRTLVIDCDLAARQLTRSLTEATLPGLPEALAAGHVNGYTQDMAGLSVLTAGSADSLDANTIDPASMRRLIENARQNYSVILIDTGPILGSIEGSLAAREADGAILTISRGQEQPLVKRALGELQNLGTSVVGVVFNRAESRDFYRSVYVSNYRPNPYRHEARSDLRPSQAVRSPLGPLVRAVLASLPKALRAPR